MALRKRPIVTQPTPGRGHVPRLPHPSWRVIAAARSDGSATARIATAADFWERLGL